MKRDDIVKKLELRTKPDFLQEAGGLITTYSYWYKAANKNDIPWPKSKIGKEYEKTREMMLLREYFGGMDLEDYVVFMESIMEKSEKYLKEFFKENKDIVELFYIHKFSDIYQLSFLSNAIINKDTVAAKDYSSEDFLLDLVLAFLDILEKDDVYIEKINLKTKEDIVTEIENLDLLELIMDSYLEDKDSMNMVRSLKNYKDIHRRLIPLLENLERIISEEFYIIEDRFKQYTLELNKNNFQYCIDLMSELGLDKTYDIIEGKITVGFRVVLNNYTSIMLPIEKLKNSKMFLGLLMEDLIEFKESKFKYEVFQRKLKSLSDPTRYSIISLLREKPYFVKELADEIHLSPPTLSYHLNMLQLDGFIRLKVEGKRNYYSLRKNAFKELGEAFIELANSIKEEEDD